MWLSMSRADILAQVVSIQECLGAVEEQLDVWESQQLQQRAQGGGRGGGSAARVSSKALLSSRSNPMIVIHDTINLQVRTGMGNGSLNGMWSVAFFDCAEMSYRIIQLVLAFASYSNTFEYPHIIIMHQSMHLLMHCF
jgi:hypothetical protein